MTHSLHFIIVFTVGLSSGQVFGASTLSLSKFMSAVHEQSPELAAQKASSEAARARASGIRLNPPMVGLMQMKDSMGTNSGYEIAQEIPFPTKAVQEKKVRDLESEAQGESSTAEGLTTLAEARRSFVALWGAENHLKILKEKHNWLKEHSRISSSLSWSDTSSKIHQLEVESEADLIENEISSFESELAEKKAALQVYVPGMDLDNIKLEEPPLARPRIETSKKSLMISSKEKELAAKEAQVGLKKQSYLPDLYLRVRSFEGTNMVPKSQELMVGVTIPFLFFWQPKAEVSEAAAERLRAASELQKVKTEVESKIVSTSRKIDTIESQLKILNTKLIPRADRRMKLVRNVSQRTMEGLDEHRMVMISHLDLQMKVVDLRIEHENAVTELLKLTGTSLEEGMR